MPHRQYWLMPVRRFSPDNGCRGGSIATLGQLNFCEQECCYVPYHIVANCGEIPHVANNCMISGDDISLILTVLMVESPDLFLCDKNIRIDFTGLIL